MSKVVLLLCLVSVTVDSYYCWVTDINVKMLTQSIKDFNGVLPSEEIASDEPDSDTRINFALPGTNWCGPGNVADGYDDLGHEKEADKCCREHDYCPDIIPGGETKYNLTNTAFYTRLNCECDYKFHSCLRAADTKTANFVGGIYFNILQTKCYKEEYPVTECVKKGGLLNSKCEEYSYNVTGDKLYQWFDVPDY